ncbi:hypothetical protein [Streptomyces sp. NPDC093261]|uniref:hypothetical protein n=1 Tax=Streptomyces sp. NPDC093261 TaxID=3366037 RepID=UPI003804A5BE
MRGTLVAEGRLAVGERQPGAFLGQPHIREADLGQDDGRAGDEALAREAGDRMPQASRWVPVVTLHPIVIDMGRLSSGKAA